MSMVRAIRPGILAILLLLPGAAPAATNHVDCGPTPNWGGRSGGSVTHTAINSSGDTLVGYEWCLGPCASPYPSCNNYFVGYGGPGEATITATRITVTGLNIPPGENYVATLTHAGTYVQCYTYADPECASEAPGTVGEASEPSEPVEQMRASWDPVEGMIDVTYTPACGASDHRIYLGSLSAVSSYDWSGEVCACGTSGETSFEPPPGSIFFVIVGDDAATEGSYGRDSSGGERPEDLRAITCEQPQDLTNSCSD